jgi:hypothetical protein
MSKRTVFTTISPLPVDIPREVVLEFLHNHLEMIDLNPLVKERHPIKPPAHATPEEFNCIWYALTDKISYLPGGLAAGDVSYTCAFHDLPTGLQTHCYAPMGLEIRDKWTLAGSLPGEPVEAVELGIGAPITGLYIREDVDMRCNVFMAGFVKRTLKRAHSTLVDRLKVKAQIVTAAENNHRVSMHQAAFGSWQQQLQQQQQQLAGPHHPGMIRRGSVPVIPPIDSSVFMPAVFDTPSSFGSHHPYHHTHCHSPHPDDANSPVSDYMDHYPAKLRNRSSSFANLRDTHGRISWHALKTQPSISSRRTSITAADFSPYDTMNPYADLTLPHYPAVQQPVIAELHSDIHEYERSRALAGKPILAELE